MLNSFSVIPAVHQNRLSIIWNVIRPSHFLYIIFHMVLAGFFASCCTGLIGGPYGTLVTLCEREEVTKECLAEEHLFLVLYGMYMVSEEFYYCSYHSEQQYVDKKGTKVQV